MPGLFLPVRRVTVPLAVVLSPCGLDLIDAQLIGKHPATARQGDAEGRHHSVAAMLDANRPGGHADMVAAQSDQPHHVGQRTLVQIAGIAVEVVRERLDHTARIAGFGRVRYRSNGLTNLLFIRRVSTACECKHGYGERQGKSVRLRPTYHMKISLQRGLPLCGGYAPMRQRMEYHKPSSSIHRQC